MNQEYVKNVVGNDAKGMNEIIRIVVIRIQCCCMPATDSYLIRERLMEVE